MTLGDFPIAGKVAVVTGGGSGINLSFAKLAVQQGARVLIADLQLTSEAKRFLEDEGSKAAVFVKCDVTKRADLENLIKASENKFRGVPDVYIAGAGVFEPAWSNFWDDTEDDRYAEVDINVNHPLKLSRIAIRALLRNKKKGVILIIASIAGYSGSLSAPLYCATKHAIVGFVRSMADLDRLEGIKVVAVAPGIVKTPLWTDRPENIRQWSVSDENSLAPEDVAKEMIELVARGDYAGGTCLEMRVQGSRILGTWNIEAPAGYGVKVSDEVKERLYAPAMEAMRKDRDL